MARDIKPLMDRFNPKVKGIVHIGAHTGEEYPEYVGYGIENQLWFEPQPEPFEKLKARVNGNKNCIIENMAVGNTVGPIQMHVSDKHDASSSILKPKFHIAQYPDITFNREILVQQVTLDYYMECHNLYGLYNLMNIDVQGYELQVFSGSVCTLREIDYILTEVNCAELYEECALIDDVDCFLRIYSFERVYLEWKEDTWGNAIYAKHR